LPQVPVEAGDAGDRIAPIGMHTLQPMFAGQVWVDLCAAMHKELFRAANFLTFEIFRVACVEAQRARRTDTFP
jgi:hypothetical protein